ncbi:MAG: hypothetical protein HW410_1686 [Nitrosarchaeum sp.]|nr:hypothetical protein [Nitrosarchaeum sp.]
MYVDMQNSPICNFDDGWKYCSQVKSMTDLVLLNLLSEKSKILSEENHWSYIQEYCLGPLKSEFVKITDKR